MGKLLPMAKRIVDEEMKFEIIINGDNARKELYALEKATRRLTEENKGLNLQKKLFKQNLLVQFAGTNWS